MQTLIEERFANGMFPADWEVSKAELASVPGGIRSARRVDFQLLLPAAGGDSVRVELDVELGAPACIACSNADIVIELNVSGFKYPRHSVAKNFMHLLAESLTPVPERRGRCTVAFTFAPDRLAGEVDGELLIAAVDPYPRPTSRVISFILSGAMLIRGLRVLGSGGNEPSRLPKPTAAADFHLEQAVDFHGFMTVAPFTRKLFDRLLAEFAGYGVRRVHWIHYGSREEGWWDHASWGTEVNAAKTFDNVGDIMAMAVRAAHSNGLEIYGMFKPFDMIFGTRFVSRHPELLLARKPGAHGPPLNSTVSRIDIVKEDDRAAEIGVDDLKLYVSDDNIRYTLYAGPVRRSEGIEDYPLYAQTASGIQPTGRSRRSRVLRLEGLEIRQRFSALAVDGRTGSFTNTLANLLHVFGERGEEPRITCGFVTGPRYGPAASSFTEGGVAFDFTGDTPTACFPGYVPMEWPRSLDAGRGFIAFARGKDAGALAALSPAFAETRQWWLSWVRQILDAGADGVELRMRNHHDHLSWAEYGFEKPIRDEFLRRHGVDLWGTDAFDRPALRRLRGDYYTQFVREAKALVSQYGKKLGLHVSVSMDMEAEQGAAMEIHWDWRRWLEEGLADSVTMKEVIPGSRFSDEILALTMPRRIPVVYSPYNAKLSVASLPAQIRHAREAGYAGFQQYNPLMRGMPDETIGLRATEWIEVLRRHFKP